MTRRTSFKTNQQSVEGGMGTNVTGTVLAVAPLTVHTCPTGKKQRVQIYARVTSWGGVGRNIRLRVNGQRIQEWNDTDDPSPTAVFKSDTIILNSAETVTMTTQNTGTEGAAVEGTPSILDEVPV